MCLCVTGLGWTAEGKGQTKRRQQMCVVEEEQTRETVAGRIVGERSLKWGARAIPYPEGFLIVTAPRHPRASGGTHTSQTPLSH